MAEKINRQHVHRVVLIECFDSTLEVFVIANAPVHRAAANDIDFRALAARAPDGYPTYFGKLGGQITNLPKFDSP